MFTDQILSIPNPKNVGELRLKYDLKNVFTADVRVAEIAFITPTKGPELLTLFCVAIRDLAGYLADLQYQSTIAAKKKRERRAVVVVDIIPTKLAEKKLSNNDTNREAVVELDPEYSVLADIEAEIDAAYTYIREKFRTMESHLNAAKRALDATSFHYKHTENTNLIQTPKTQPDEPTEMLVGKARYNGS